MKIITIANQKGGTGKTTTTLALGEGLREKGYKVLLIDLDPQCNLTFAMKGDSKVTINEVLEETVKAADSICHSTIGDIICGSIVLAGADMRFTAIGREYILSSALEGLEGYDYILIDTPPTLGILTINALTASNEVIIPLGADIFSAQGLSQLNTNIAKIKKYSNPKLEIAGALLTKYNDRTNIGKGMMESIKAAFGDKLFNTYIRTSVAVQESQAMQEPLLSGKSSPASDYKNLVTEYLSKGA